jgi:hypothetical protein
MLGDLTRSLAHNHLFLSEYYFWYVKDVLFIFTFGISLLSVSWIRKSEGGKHRQMFYKFAIFLPLFLAPILVMIGLFGFLDSSWLLLLILSYIIPYLFIRGRVFLLFLDGIKSSAVFLWKDRNFMIFIFIISLTVRCLFAVNIISKTVSIGGENGFILASDDGDTYDKCAQSIVKDSGSQIGKDIKIWGCHFDYAYAVFLAGLYKMFGRNFYAVTFIQSLLGAIIPVMVFLIGRLIFSKWAGILAAIAAALKSPVIFFSVVLGHEAVWVPFLVLFILGLSIYYKKNCGGVLWAAVSGIALGFVCIFRGLYLSLIPFTILWVVLFWRNKLSSERFRAAGLFAVSVFAVIISTAVIFRSPLSIGSENRIKILWGSEHLDRFSGGFRNMGNERLIKIGINFAEDLPGAVAKIAKNPAPFLNVAGQIYPLRVFAYLSVYQYGFFDPVYLVNSAKWHNNFMPTLEFYFMFFFIYGMIRCLTRLNILKSPVFIIFVYCIIVSAFIFSHVTIRQRAPLTPFIYLIGSYGLVMILRHLRILKDDCV